MLKLLTVPVATFLLFVGALAAQDEKAKAVTLVDAVKEFNLRAQDDPIGKTQPMLTEDEVVAAIRGWVREQFPATDDVYLAYQTIADTRTLPPGATLSFVTNWSGFKKYQFDVWWVDLSITTGAGTGFTFRLRDQKLRCRPIGEVKWIKWNADGFRPILTESLTDTQMERIRKFQKFFVEVDEQTVDQWVDNFKRVPNPDQELAVRDKMSRAYATYCAGRELDIATKKEVYRIVCLRGLLTESHALKQLEQLELKWLPKDDAVEIIKAF